jgi:hypothetical protein
VSKTLRRSSEISLVLLKRPGEKGDCGRLGSGLHEEENIHCAARKNCKKSVKASKQVSAGDRDF